MTDKRDKKIIEWNDEEPYREPVDETKPFDVRYPWELRYNKYIENTQLSIYESGWQYCSPGYKYGPARWGYFLLHFIVNGRGTLTVNNTSYKLSRNQVFLRYPIRIRLIRPIKSYRGIITGWDLTASTLKNF